MTCQFNYPYSLHIEEVEAALEQSLLTIEVWDMCAKVEDAWIANNKHKLMRGRGKGGRFNSTIPKNTWKSLIYCLNQSLKAIKPDNTKYLSVLNIDSIASIKANRVHWYCKCVCGTIVSILAKNIVSGHTKSCGCASSILRKNTNKKIYNVDVSSKSNSVKVKAQSNLESKGMVPVERLHTMNVGGMSCVEIAKELGYSNNSVVTSRLIRAGYKIVNRHSVCDDVLTLHILNSEDKLSCSEIADRLGYASASGVRNRLIASGYTPIVYNTEVSLPHKKILEFLDYKGIDYIVNDSNMLSGCELDVYIPKHKLAIEIDGVYWHSETKGKGSSYHLQKTNKCESLGVQLLHFWDTEINKNFKLVTSMILAKCGLIKSRKFARKLHIVSICTREAREFLQCNHLQGYSGASTKLALVDVHGSIECVLTIGKARYTDASWEVIRYANRVDAIVVGGFSRLLSHFRKQNKGSIVSYANRRFSNGSVYEALGFTLVNKSKPCYYYFSNSDTNTLYHRSKFMKHKLPKLLSNFDITLSEVENMKNNNYNRVFDCGTYVYKLEEK